MENLKKCDRVLIFGTHEAFIVSKNVEKRLYYALDFHNNITSISFDDNFKKIEIQQDDIPDLVCCLLGLEDNRFSHWDEESVAVAQEMDINPKFKDLKSSLENAVGNKRPYSIEANSQEIRVITDEDPERAIVVPHNLEQK